MYTFTRCGVKMACPLFDVPRRLRHLHFRPPVSTASRFEQVHPSCDTPHTPSHLLRWWQTTGSRSCRLIWSVNELVFHESCRCAAICAGHLPSVWCAQRPCLPPRSLRSIRSSWAFVKLSAFMIRLQLQVPQPVKRAATVVHGQSLQGAVSRCGFRQCVVPGVTSGSAVGSPNLLTGTS